MKKHSMHLRKIFFKKIANRNFNFFLLLFIVNLYVGFYHFQIKYKKQMRLIKMTINKS